MSAPDEVLWAAAVAGDEDAFAAIFRRHKDAVFVQCARRAGSYEGADDLVSVVFLEAWRSRQRVRFVDGSLRPWLLLVASHVAAKRVRSAARYDSLIRRYTTVWTATDSDADLEERLDAESLAPHLATALARLNQGEQDVVALCDLADFRHLEAATALDIPIGTVKSRLNRAHRKLRVELGPILAATLGITDADSLQEVES